MCPMSPKRCADIFADSRLAIKQMRNTWNDIERGRLALLERRMQSMKRVMSFKKCLDSIRFLANTDNNTVGMNKVWTISYGK